MAGITRWLSILPIHAVQFVGVVASQIFLNESDSIPYTMSENVPVYV